jgi:membrane protein implicated in regulation of membrane protease activity
MYIVPVVWLYVAFMMAVAEATSPIGTLLGAAITFLLYGLLPIGLILYFMGSSGRRRANRQVEQAQADAAAVPTIAPTGSNQGDGSGHAPADAVTPEREKPRGL